MSRDLKQASKHCFYGIGSPGLKLRSKLQCQTAITTYTHRSWVTLRNPSVQRENMFVVALHFLFLLTCGVTLGQEAALTLKKVGDPCGGDAVLPLSIGRNAERDLFDWRRVGHRGETLHEVFLYAAGLHYNNGHTGQSQQFKGRVSHFPAELKHGNASILIRNATAADAGNYTCYFPHLQPPQKFYFELDVDWALLRCEVPGASLNTRAEWQSGDGNRLEAEEERVPEKEHVFISLSLNVARGHLYRCVVSQEDIKHRLSAQTCEKESEDCYSSGAMVIVGITSLVLGAVLLAAVQALLVFAKCIKILHNNGSALQGEEEIHTGNGFSNGTDGPVRVPPEEPLQSAEC